MLDKLPRVASTPAARHKEPVQVEGTCVREPELAVCKTLTGNDRPDSIERVKSKVTTFTDWEATERAPSAFMMNGNRTVRVSFHRSHTTVEACTALKDKTNSHKSMSVSGVKAATQISTPSRPAKPVIKQKTIAADGQVIAVNGVAVTTSKRPRDVEETQPSERPTKKRAKKRAATEGTDDVALQPAFEATTDAPVEAPASLAVVKKASAEPTTISVCGKLNQRDAGTTSQNAVANAVSQTVKNSNPTKAASTTTTTTNTSDTTNPTSKPSKATPKPRHPTPNPSKPKQDIARPMKKARKSRTTASNTANPKKTKKTKYSRSRTPDDDLALIQEAIDGRMVVDGPRRTRAAARACLTWTSPSPSPSPSPTPSPSPALPSSPPTKRKHAGFADEQAGKRRAGGRGFRAA